MIINLRFVFSQLVSKHFKNKTNKRNSTKLKNYTPFLLKYKAIVNLMASTYCMSKVNTWETKGCKVVQ